MRSIDSLAVENPFIHSPEVSAALLQVQTEGIDHASHERQMLGRPDRTADTRGIIGSGLLPGINVFERLRAVKLLDCVEELDRKPRAAQLFEVFGSQLGRILENGFIESRIVPPTWRQFTQRSHRNLLLLIVPVPDSSPDIPRSGVAVKIMASCSKAQAAESTEWQSWFED